MRLSVGDPVIGMQVIVVQYSVAKYPRLQARSCDSGAATRHDGESGERHIRPYIDFITPSAKS